MDIKIGEVIGFWEVIGPLTYIKGIKHLKCKCKCDRIKDVNVYNLAHKRSLGCVSCTQRKINNGAGDPRDLIGTRVGKRIVRDYLFLKNGAHFRMECDCGKITNVRYARILNNETSACRNCNKTEFVEIGTVLGKRTIIGIDMKSSKRIYTAQCECGHIFKGSLTKFKNREACVSCCQRQHGPIRKVVFGYDTHITRIWTGIFDRCYNENHHAYHLYGGRGIKVHPRYYDMQNFIDDVGQRPSSEHSIDRIDSEKGYSPGNIRWADKKEQAENRRRSKKNHGQYITIKISDLCKECLTKYLREKL